MPVAPIPAALLPPEVAPKPWRIDATHDWIVVDADGHEVLGIDCGDTADQDAAVAHLIVEAVNCLNTPAGPDATLPAHDARQAARAGLARIRADDPAAARDAINQVLGTLLRDLGCGDVLQAWDEAGRACGVADADATIRALREEVAGPRATPMHNGVHNLGSVSAKSATSLANDACCHEPREPGQAEVPEPEVGQVWNLPDGTEERTILDVQLYLSGSQVFWRHGPRTNAVSQPLEGFYAWARRTHARPVAPPAREPGA